MSVICIQFICLVVVVKAQPSNIALGKPAYQSSSLNIGNCILNASKAVDGNRNPDTYTCSCSHIADVYGDPMWLSVDLLTKYLLDFVVVYNRIGNNIVSGRLSNMWAGLTNVDVTVKPPQRGQYPLCGQCPGNIFMVGVVKCNYNLPPGRFLIAQMDLNAGDGKGMAICELEAFEVIDPYKGYIWRPRKQARLIGFVSSTLRSKETLSACIIICISNDPRCDSVNHNQVTDTCEFNIHPKGFNLSSIANQANWNVWSGTFV